jgi:hypothetical protein
MKVCSMYERLLKSVNPVFTLSVSPGGSTKLPAPSPSDARTAVSSNPQRRSGNCAVESLAR